MTGAVTNKAKPAKNTKDLEEGKENTKPIEAKKDVKKAEAKEEAPLVAKKRNETLANDKEVLGTDNKMKSNKTTVKESVSLENMDKMAGNNNFGEVKRLKLELAEKDAMVEDANREVAQIKEQLNEAKKVVSMTSASKDHAEMERD